MSGYGIPQAIIMALFAMAVIDSYKKNGQYEVKLYSGDQMLFGAVFFTFMLYWGGFFS